MASTRRSAGRAVQFLHVPGVDSTEMAADDVVDLGLIVGRRPGGRQVWWRIGRASERNNRDDRQDADRSHYRLCVDAALLTAASQCTHALRRRLSGGDGASTKTLGAGAARLTAPYPGPKTKISNLAVHDNGKNFGRSARSRGLMDEFVADMAVVRAAHLGRPLGNTPVNPTVRNSSCASSRLSLIHI